MSLTDNPKKEFDIDNVPGKGSEEDMSKDGNSQKLDPVKEYNIRHNRDPEKIDYKTEINNRYIV